MGKLLLIIGIICIIAGLFFIFNIRIPFLGRLPGDIFIQGENVQFYFPIVTCLIISVVISILFYLFSGR